MEFDRRPLKNHLWDLELRQRKLAKMTGLSEPVISNAVTQGRASILTQVKIARALGVSVSELFPPSRGA
jgi:hypothetical protein